MPENIDSAKQNNPHGDGIGKKSYTPPPPPPATIKPEPSPKPTPTADKPKKTP